MSRKTLCLAAVAALAAVPCGSVFAQNATQNPPASSLGDIARQVRAQKNSDQPKTVITNDNLGANPGLTDLRYTPAPAAAGSLKSSPAPGSAAPAAGLAGVDAQKVKSSLDGLDALLNQLDSLDRATLVKNVLQGNDADFPGRANWEQHLLAARQTYVFHGRELTQYARQLMAAAQVMDAAHVPASDPRMVDLGNKLAQFIQDCTRTGATFQAVEMEGRDLAKASAH